MNDFTDMLSKAKEMKKKMEQVQESLKNIEVEGVSGGNLVKIILKGDYEMKSIVMDKNVEKEKNGIINDLIIAAYNDAKD